MIKESELDADQIRVLQATLDKSCVISGCAGSGKSVLALIKAQRIQKERGNNYEIIVYTKALCRYMNSGREMLGLTKPFYYHWRWKNDLNCPSADYVIVDEIQDFEEDEIKEFIDAAKNISFSMVTLLNLFMRDLKIQWQLKTLGICSIVEISQSFGNFTEIIGCQFLWQNSSNMLA